MPHHIKKYSKPHHCVQVPVGHGHRKGVPCHCVQVPVGHGHRKGVRGRGNHDIYLYMYTKDGGEVSLEGTRHCSVVWLQPQRQISNCEAALELTSSSDYTARAGQRSNWKAALKLHGSGQAALRLHSSSRSATARAGQLSNCQTEAHTEVRLEGTRVVWLQPLRTDCAHGLRLICQMCE